ncbi:hypothetical protein [Chelativorans sp. YIM 93263]|uniref:hypothetical protein n=1 Tax=Chelativorans sp. YIM 93263 TaxID=2906648 RepID=UPI002379E719|nr:hypothetical protein [Chelativorans sp. YIM 93263]
MTSSKKKAGAVSNGGRPQALQPDKRTPQGTNATGEGDEKKYYQRIGAEQELTLRPRWSACLPSRCVRPLASILTICGLLRLYGR